MNADDAAIQALRARVQDRIDQITPRIEHRLKSFRNRLLGQLGLNSFVVVAAALTNVALSFNPIALGGTVVLAVSAIGSNLSRFQTAFTQYSKDSGQLGEVPYILKARLTKCGPEDSKCLQGVDDLIDKVWDTLSSPSASP